MTKEILTEVEDGKSNSALLHRVLQLNNFVLKNADYYSEKSPKGMYSSRLDTGFKEVNHVFSIQWDWVSLATGIS